MEKTTLWTQGQRLPKKPNLSTPDSWSSAFENCKKIDVCPFSCLVCGTLAWNMLKPKIHPSCLKVVSRSWAHHLPLKVIPLSQERKLQVHSFVLILGVYWEVTSDGNWDTKITWSQFQASELPRSMHPHASLFLSLILHPWLPTLGHFPLLFSTFTSGQS